MHCAWAHGGGCCARSQRELGISGCFGAQGVLGFGLLSTLLWRYCTAGVCKGNEYDIAYEAYDEACLMDDYLVNIEPLPDVEKETLLP